MQILISRQRQDSLCLHQPGSSSTSQVHEADKYVPVHNRQVSDSGSTENEVLMNEKCPIEQLHCISDACLTLVCVVLPRGMARYLHENKAD